MRPVPGTGTLQCGNQWAAATWGCAMNDQIFDVFRNPSVSFLAPSRELSKLALEKLEQLAAMQFAALRDYTDLNIGQMKAATELSGPEDLQDYFAKQQEFMKTVGEKMLGDAQALAAIGKEFVEEAQKIAMKGVPGVGDE